MEGSEWKGIMREAWFWDEVRHEIDKSGKPSVVVCVGNAGGEEEYAFANCDERVIPKAQFREFCEFDERLNDGQASDQRFHCERPVIWRLAKQCGEGGKIFANVKKMGRRAQEPHTWAPCDPCKQWCEAAADYFQVTIVFNQCRLTYCPETPGQHGHNDSAEDTGSGNACDDNDWDDTDDFVPDENDSDGNHDFAPDENDSDGNHDFAPDENDSDGNGDFAPDENDWEANDWNEDNDW